MTTDHVSPYVLKCFEAAGSDPERQFLFLERLFPRMTEQERSDTLTYLWCERPFGNTPSSAARLFRSVPLLRETVPADWPNELLLYRGAWSTTWAGACDAVRRGLSWSTDRTVAEWFARVPRDEWVGKDVGVGCVGTARVRQVESPATATTRSAGMRANRPTEARPLSPGPCEARSHALLNTTALKLSQGGQDVKLQPTGRRGAVDALAKADEGHPKGLELVEKRHEVSEVSAEAIEPPANQDAEAPTPCIAEEPVKCRSSLLRPAHALVDVLVSGPASRLGVLSQFRELILRFLVKRRDAGVDRHLSHRYQSPILPTRRALLPGSGS